MKNWLVAGCLFVVGCGASQTDAESYLQDPNRLPWYTVVEIANGHANVISQHQVTPEERQAKNGGKIGTNTISIESYPCSSPFFEVSDGSSIDYGDHLCLVDHGNDSSYPTTLNLGDYCLVGSNCSLGNWSAHIRSYRAGYMATVSRAHPKYGTTDCVSGGIHYTDGDVSAPLSSCIQNADKFFFTDVIQ